jgi:hypothetical protein
MSLKLSNFQTESGKTLDPFLLEAVHRPVPNYLLDMDTEILADNNPQLPYRTLVVRDGAGTVLECSLTLTDYSMRPENELRERYSSLILTDDQNRRLVNLLESFDEEEKNGHGRDTPPLPDQDQLASGAKRSRGQFEIVSAAEQNDLLERVSPEARKPFTPPSKVAAVSVSPQKAKKRRNLTHRVGPLQDITDPDKERIPCEYKSGSIQCGNMAKKRHIYCDHHLRVASMKNESRKDLKRSLSAASLSHSGSADEEYPEFLSLGSKGAGIRAVDEEAAPVVEYWNEHERCPPKKGRSAIAIGKLLGSKIPGVTASAVQ